MRTPLPSATPKIEWGRILIILFFFLLLPPIIGIPLIIGYMFLKSNITKQDYYLFFLCIAFYIGSVNATKFPDGDQVNYFFAYKNVPTIGFWKSLIYIYGAAYNRGYNLTNISGEFMNGIYNYIGYYITFGYYPLFECLLSVFDLLCVFLGLYHFAQKLRKPHIPIVCGTLILAFFYMYFNLMLQIQKQFLGQAIMMYVIGYYARFGVMTKKLWVIAAVSVFTHAANILFIPFLIYKPLRSRLSKSSLPIMGGIFLIVIFLGPNLASNIISDNSNSTLTYSMRRLAFSERNNDGGVINFLHPRQLITLIPMLYILIKHFCFNRKKTNNAQMFILNILLLLNLAVFTMFRQPLAQYRYFMMTYTFIPYFMPFIFRNIKYRDTLLKYSSLASVITFFYFFEDIYWIYAYVADIILFPPIWLIFSNYNGL